MHRSQLKKKEEVNLGLNSIPYKKTNLSIMGIKSKTQNFMNR